MDMSLQEQECTCTSLRVYEQVYENTNLLCEL
jgi:hypothetical protein